MRSGGVSSDGASSRRRRSSYPITTNVFRTLNAARRGVGAGVNTLFGGRSSAIPEEDEKCVGGLFWKDMARR